ncbi:MAG: cupin domain-containing protein [Polyangiaceae bacterium]|nr:cupin domain-containing protein [Polyangiaceae bacterium]
MADTTVSKVDGSHSPRGSHGETYLASGVRASMRLWDEAPGEKVEGDVARDYEVIGYVISGRAELHTEGQVVTLAPGDSYVVPRGAYHHYHILEAFRAVEATSPPAHVHGRDEASTPEVEGDPLRQGKGRRDEVDAKHGVFPPGAPHPQGAEVRAPGTIGGGPYDESGRGGPAPVPPRGRRG